ncbi:glycolate oxidase subunit (Fe-S) protein [[Synechococcus] sp. NIES-970]|nr:glycolate oxidase subunit (Fe-S) protein [[Synechococcus] sp. NIES-970]
MTLSEAKSSGFDPQHPPEQGVIDSCVHCGFCLDTCPSYRVLGSEMDSPRGRIYLMEAIAKGEAEINSATVQHFDSCLGCLACTSACPSGVRYDELLASMRAQIERNYTRSLGDRLFRWLIFNLFPYPGRLKIFLPLLWFYQNFGLQWLVRKLGLLKPIPRLAAMELILPKVNLQTSKQSLPTLIPAQGEKRYRVGMVLGCVQRLFFSPVNEATARVLTANGCEVVIPQGQGCCAALPAHQGQTTQAQELARQMIDRFGDQDLDYIIINAAGCGHTLKEYGRILQDDPAYAQKAQEFSAKVRDAQEFLATVGLTTPLHPLTSEPFPLVYQDACHLLHGQKIAAQPRELLQKIPNLELREPVEHNLCCGSAGVFNLLQPEIAAELGERKARNLVNTGAKAIASANPGCSLQIQQHLQAQGQTIPLWHPMELLDFAIRGVPLPL